MSSPLLSASPVAMPIDVVSDVVCPWCYIGKRRLEKALKIRADIAVEVRALLASSTDVEHVEREANAAKEAGIDGVPCFIFGAALAVSGAQAAEYLADAMARAAAQWARGATPQDARMSVVSDDLERP